MLFVDLNSTDCEWLGKIILNRIIMLVFFFLFHFIFFDLNSADVHLLIPAKFIVVVDVLMIIMLQQQKNENFISFFLLWWNLLLFTKFNWNKKKRKIVIIAMKWKLKLKILGCFQLFIWFYRFMFLENKNRKKTNVFFCWKRWSMKNKRPFQSGLSNNFFFCEKDKTNK